MSVRVEDDGDLAVLVLDRDDAAPNVVDDRLLDGLERALERVAADERRVGAVITSARSDFLVGADIDPLYALTDPADVLALARRFQAALRRLETLGKPVVAALHGRALGGGLELALACHGRVATDAPGTRLGLPEIRLGLMPGGGATQRLPRLAGMRPALDMMLDGRERGPAEARSLGLIDTLVDSPGQLVDAARERIAVPTDARRPWDRGGFAWPGDDPRSRTARQHWMAAPASLQRRGLGNLPAARGILAAVFEGSRTGVEAGCRIEARRFAHVATGRAARNTLRVLWYELNRVRRGAARPAGIAPRTFERVAVLGAGMMGAGIAHLAARSGLEVAVKDVDRVHAERAREHARQQWDRAIERGRATGRDRDAALARMTVAGADDALGPADLVIEAVDEERTLKERVLAEAAAAVGPDAIIASNTSSLPIGSLAAACDRPRRFLGLHFFSPVERMPLLEIIRGRDTDAATVAHAFDFARRIGKTPVCVNDGRGFFTSRVFAAYVLEGAALVGEGRPPALVEHAATGAGMPIGPLALTDEVSLTLILRILDQARAEGDDAGAVHPGETVIRTLVERHHRPGRRGGGGFYALEDAGRRLWPGLTEAFPPTGATPAAADVAERLLLIQANEAARAFDEGIVERVADADVASVLGWGFPAAAGGVLGSIDDRGAAATVARLEALAGAHGSRFTPAECLRRMARDGTTFARQAPRR